MKLRPTIVLQRSSTQLTLLRRIQEQIGAVTKTLELTQIVILFTFRNLMHAHMLMLCPLAWPKAPYRLQPSWPKVTTKRRSSTTFEWCRGTSNISDDSQIATTSERAGMSSAYRERTSTSKPEATLHTQYPQRQELCTRPACCTADMPAHCTHGEERLPLGSAWDGLLLLRLRHLRHQLRPEIAIARSLPYIFRPSDARLTSAQTTPGMQRCKHYEKT